MTHWIWVLEATALAVHSEQLRQHGGGDGVRDIGLLLSALARPEHLAAYTEPDAASLAASYAFGITCNHPFIDGNKRTAYVVSELFLALNGYELIASDADGVVTFIALAAGDLSQDQLAQWFRANLIVGTK